MESVAAVLTSVGGVVTSIVGMFGDIITFITGNYLLLAIVLLPVAYGIIRKGVKLVMSRGKRI